jgi:hypothetical protein
MKETSVSRGLGNQPDPDDEERTVLPKRWLLSKSGRGTSNEGYEMIKRKAESCQIDS